MDAEKNKKKKNEREIEKMVGRTHEEIVCVGIGTTDSKELHKIMELTMNIAAYRNRASL